jgi:Uncharacterized alpha/beta hydrolase domain (DUF2235)
VYRLNGDKTNKASSLGVPQVWFLPQRNSKHYAFVDTSVESNIEYAFQALALDERRGPFTPTIWAASDKPPKELKQCWFRGVHCDIGGGGYPDQELANLSLAWMISQLESKALLQFDHAIFWKLVKSSAAFQTKKMALTPAMPKLKGWGLGEIHNSMAWYYKIATGQRIREPRSFTQSQWHPPWWKQMLSLFSAKKPGPPLENTHECMHASVGMRQTREGTACDALKNWSYNESSKMWTKPGVEPLLEDKLQGLELELVEGWESIVANADHQARSAV